MDQVFQPNTDRASSLIAGQIGGAMKIHCPKCGFDYNHLIKTRIARGLESAEIAGDQPDFATRGDGVILEFWCEEGHEWELAVMSHKGQLYAACREK